MTLLKIIDIHKNFLESTGYIENYQLNRIKSETLQILKHKLTKKIEDLVNNSEKIEPFWERGYFDLPPLDPTEDIKMETMMCLEAAGFQLDKVHHEVAMGQQEINFRYSDALKTADNVLLYKLAVKTMVEHTSTGLAPWNLIPANDKLFARIEVLKTVCEQLSDVIETK